MDAPSTASFAPLGTNLFHAQTVLKMPLGLRLPARMTVAKLADGSVLLHSPIRIDDPMAAAIEALGPVRHIVSPNRFHHLYAGKAQQRWPQAELHGAPGLAEKRSDLTFASTLGDTLCAPLARDFDACVVGGAPRLGEVVLFHRASGALIAADLIFNLLEPEDYASRFFTSVMGTRGRLAQSRLMRVSVNDRGAHEASVKHMLEWPIERVVMAHGQPVTDDAKTRLRAAFWWSLREKPAS